MKKYRIKTLVFMSLLSVSAIALPRNSILSLKETITDSAIVYPKSFETDTKELMNNWYLQNYTVLDQNVENRSTGDVSDAEYISRLKAIPSIIELPYNQVVRSYIERYITKNRTLVEEMLGMSLYYMPIFEQSLEKKGLPLELKYLPVIESALNPNAVSPVGATGLWQFMIGTGKNLGLEINSLVDERRDPYRSSEAAASYLKSLYNIYNDWSLAIAAYNCGPNNVNKALRRAGGDNEKKDFWAIYEYLPRETRGYVPAFIAANYIMTYFQRHNISPSLAKKPLITDSVQINHRVNLNQVAAVLNMPIDEIRILNPQYRHDVIPGDTHKYSLVLPSQQVYSYIMSEDSIINYRTDLYGHRDVVEPVTEVSSSNNSSSSSSSARSYTYKTKQVVSYHKVHRGENLRSIAYRYGMTLSSIKAVNGLRSSRVRRGQSVKVVSYRRYKVYNDNNEEEEDNSEEVADNTTQSSGDSANNSQTEPADNSEETQNVVAQESKNSPYKGSYSIDSPAPKKESKESTTKKVAKTETEPAVKSAKSESSSKTAENSSSSVKKSKSTKVAEEEQTEEQNSSKQWRSRNERYANSKRGYSSRENTYKKSRSSKRTRTVAPIKARDYSVKSGETLSEIADRNNVSLSTLRKLNGIKGDMIRSGDNLKIPSKNAKASTTKKSKKSRRHRR
jgi:membrane-bound lytic murein transglycosylase D